MASALLLSATLLIAQADPAPPEGARPEAAAPPAAGKAGEPGKTPAPPPNGLNQILPFIVIGGVFLLITARSSSKQAAKQREFLASLRKNDRVVTSGGLIGVVVSIKEDAPNEPAEVTLKIDEDNKTRVKVLRTSVSSILSRDPEPAAG